MNKLLASTAIVAMTALPLAAQTSTETTAPETTAPMSTDSTAPAASDSTTMEPAETDTAADATMGTGDFTYTPMNTELMASDFIGKNVYVSEGEIATTAVNDADADWEDVGTISDVLMSREGQAEAILVDIGGFLGIGAKTVAVDMEQLNIIEDGDNIGDYFVAFSANREALENAPEFEVVNADETMATDTTTTAATDTSTDTMTGTTATTGMADTSTDTTTDTMADTSATEPTAADPMATDTTTGVAETDMGSGDPMEGMVDPTTLTAEQLQGAPVYDSNDERIGDISELVVAADGTISEAVVDIGGFLGIGAKPVALNFDQIQVMAEDAEGSGIRVQLTATEEELDAMPEYEG